ncbi:MAG TPA: hypothetical protein VER33_05920 [Polyangiaceae bacterium]|nr:hypothetical protein [Polyangiaceae bacterium]
MRRIQPYIAIAGAMALPVSAAAGPGQPLSVALLYEVAPGAAGCPSDLHFRGLVGEQLRYEAFNERAALRLRARIRPDQSGALAGTLVWSDAAAERTGERRLTSPSGDCAELARAMSFAIAVQIQLLSTSATDVQPADEAAAGKAKASRPGARSEQLALPPRKRSRQPGRVLAFGGGPTASHGIAPSLSAGARLFGTIGTGPFSLELALEPDLPVTQTQPDGSGFRFSSYGGSLAPCTTLDPLMLCVLAGMGRVRVEGFGVDEVRAPSSTTARAGLRLGFGLPLRERLATLVHLDALAMLTPRTVYLRGAPAWTTPDVGLRLGIDVAGLFR